MRKTWFMLLLGSLLANAVWAQTSEPERRWMRQGTDPKRVGLELLEAGELIQAKEALEAAETFAPSDARVQRALFKVYTLLGNEGLAKDDFVEAEYYFERAIDKDPGTASAWRGLGESRLRMGALDGAVEALTTAEDLNDTHARVLMVRARVRRARSALDVGDLSSADRDLEEALRRDPEDPAGLYQLGRLRVAQQRPQEALSPLQQVMETKGFRGSANLMLGRAYEALQRWQDAIEAGRRAALHPQVHVQAQQVQARAYYQWALAAYDREAWSTAEDRFAAAREYRSAWDDAIFGQGLARLKQDDGAGAKALFDQLHARRPEYRGLRTVLAQAEHKIGRARIGRGQYDGAVRILTQAAERDPRQPGILLSLAEAERARGRYQAALEAYEQALARGADAVRGHRGAMQVLDQQLGRSLAALTHAEELLVRRSEDKEARETVIRLTRQEGLRTAVEGNDEQAAELLRRHRDFVETNREVNVTLSEVYNRLLQHAEALALAKPAYASEPTDRAAEAVFVAHVGLGDEAQMINDWPGAIEHYQAALEVRETAYKVRLRLGKAYWEDGRPQHAVRHLRRVWDEAPQLHEVTADPLANALVDWADGELEQDPETAITLASEALSRKPSFVPAWYVRAQAYTALQRWSEAIADAEAAYEVAEDDPRLREAYVKALRGGAAAAMAAERWPLAADRAERWLAVDAEATEAKLRLGAAHVALNRAWLDARERLTDAADDRQWRAAATLWLARGHWQTDAPRDAARAYLRLARLDASPASVTEQTRALRSGAEQWESAGELADAEAAYERVYALLPEDGQSAYDYGRVLFAQGRAHEAAPVLRQAWRAQPNRREVALTAGRAHVQAGKPLQAVEIVEAFEPTRKDGDDEAVQIVGQAYTDAAVRAWDKQQLEDTLLYAERASRRLTRAPQPWYLLGEAQAELEQYGDAIQTFHKVYELDPAYREVTFYLNDLYTQRGWDYLEKNQLELAEAAFDNALEYATVAEPVYGLLRVAERRDQWWRVHTLAARIQETHGAYRDTEVRRRQALSEAGRSAFHDKRYGDAVSTLTMLLARDDARASAHYYLGAASFYLDEYDRAIRHLQEARIELGTDYEALRTLLARAYAARAQQRYDADDPYNALEAIDENIALIGQSTELLILRGKVYESLGQWGRAADAYREALAQPGESSIARNRLEALLTAHPNEAAPAPR